MKLYYYHDPKGNFGDDLNPWLWNRIIAELLNEDDKEIFIGIGTLINHRLPSHPVKHIFGSGFGYGSLPNIDNSYRIHALRGYKTAEALNIDRSLVITDAAVLIRTVNFTTSVEKPFKFGLIPTGYSIKNYNWQRVCEDLGLKFISCHWEVDKVLFSISQCQTLICEAMHGAIVADAMRIPWIPVSLYGNLLNFKWEDWLSTLSLPYLPTKITSLYEEQKQYSGTKKIKYFVKKQFRNFDIWPQYWSDLPPKTSSDQDRDQALQELLSICQISPLLSDDNLIDSHTNRYLELIEKFRLIQSKIKPAFALRTGEY